MSHMKIKLGVIRAIEFGYVAGYDDKTFGYRVVLGTDSWEIRDSATGMEAVERLKLLMENAKARTVQDLKGKPVRVLIKDTGWLSDWDILKDCIA